MILSISSFSLFSSYLEDQPICVISVWKSPGITVLDQCMIFRSNTVSFTNIVVLMFGGILRIVKCSCCILTLIIIYCPSQPLQPCFCLDFILLYNIKPTMPSTLLHTLPSNIF